MATITREEFAKIKLINGGTLLGAANDALIVANADMKNGAYTIAAQPTNASKVCIKITATSTADTMGIITVVGTDIFNAVISEAVIPVAGATVCTVYFYKSVTSITGSGWAVVAGADKIVVGVLASGGITVRGMNVTFMNLSGNIWINDKVVAVANTSSLKLVSGQVIDLVVSDTLSVISDAVGATFQYVIWDN